MKRFASIVLLIAGLASPVIIFWLLQSHARLNAPIAALISIAIGWALNFAWATTANQSTSIAAKFGWVCPAVLVLITGLVLRWAA